jgi:hypothetical protein
MCDNMLIHTRRHLSDIPKVTSCESVPNDVPPLGKGSDNPEISAILNDFRDGSGSKLPAG